MNEFAEMLKEAFVGEEPFDPRPGREALQASIRKYDARMKTVRYMAIFAVSFMSIVCVYSFIWLLRAPDETSTRVLLIDAIVFGWALGGIGFSKMWFAMMHNDIGLRKELRRVQMMMLDKDSH